MSFEKHFRLFSYSAVFCGFLSLWVSNSFGILETAGFIAVMAVAWRLEDSRWQINERLGTVLIVLAIPAYYFLWRFGSLSSSEMMLPGILARLILSLTAIKLLQKKSDRDWMFLYVMSFFEVLLAAGWSISIGYLASFAAYIFVMACTIIVFEIRKTGRQMNERSSFEPTESWPSQTAIPMRRVLATASVLIVVIAMIGVPTFFILPRVGGAGLGGHPGGSTFAGFSDTVKLGGIGRIQQNDEVVMRVRIDGEPPESIRWRGVALDTFDGKSWSKTKAAIKEPRTRNDRDLIQVDIARRQDGMTLQTVYLEPLDTPVIFGLHRMVAVQGNFPLLYRDTHGSITFQRTGERISYKMLSDTVFPAESRLSADRSPFANEFANYLQLPSQLDSRVGELAATITAEARNRYDAARRLESYLQTQFGYTLEQKAGGVDPLADFLFDKREGHCEYFATAMAVMLRTQGIATRVVNGFSRGDYNDAANVFVVRQRHAHSWVEVYFPETESWVAFDPTPFAGQTSETAIAGFANSFRKYVEALETFWIQYFVAFDNQEQRSLFVSVRQSFSDYQTGISSAWNVFQAEFAEWWKQVRGDEGFAVSMTAVGMALVWIAGIGLSLLLIGWLARKTVKSKVWGALWERLFARRRASVVEFYEQMLRVLASKGFTREPHQTPLEFAYAVAIPEAVDITERYNRVRFGERELSNEEFDEVEHWLKDLSATN